MHPQVAALAARLGLPEEVARQFDALFQAHGSAERTISVVTVVDGFESVDLRDADTEDADVHEETMAVPRIAGRYEDLGAIGEGGMGEVRRVRDVELNRSLAMKLVHAPMVRHKGALARFLEEAQATAQLQHPNIVPIHDVGRLPDGRLWFTMKEIRGRTLEDVVADVHAGVGDTAATEPGGWTFRKLITAFLAVCQAMAYAHERGVVHRDLKPENVMVGRHGEVYVLDWGLAKVVGRDHRPVEELATGEVLLRDALATEATVLMNPDRRRTSMGTVAGTPSFMAPEQARGEVDRIDARTDVYALGAILYVILSGRSPYGGMSAEDVVGQVRAGPPKPVRSRLRSGARLPDELVRACERAMSREPADRYPSALALAREVELWLDGARRTDEAREICRRALARSAEADALRAEASQLGAAGAAQLDGIQPWQPEGDKARGWHQQDRAEELRGAAELVEVEIDQGLHAALRVAPDLPDAHAALTERYLARHEHAERAHDPRGQARAARRIQDHAEALPEGDPIRVAAVRYLEGTGALSLVTDPPGAEVVAYRYVRRNRRLVEEEPRYLGTTPLREIPLARGSYVAVIQHGDRPPVRYPFEIPRQGHWDGRPPGGGPPAPVHLPPRGALRAGEIYVPAGWFRAGGDAEAPNGQPARRLWCDGFVIHEFPVTNRQYLAFLDDLVARGRTAEALRVAPRERAGVAGEEGPLIYKFDGRRFSIVPDADGHVWSPEWPVFHVDWYGARAYLAWLADRTDQPWRLPGEFEWEKAARGVDGRIFPFGDFVDPSWCAILSSGPGLRLPADVDSHPVDCSPYGVRGLAGNVYDWCLEAFHRRVEPVDGDRVPDPEAHLSDGPGVLRVGKGGTWDGGPLASRCAARSRPFPTTRHSNLGFRGVRRVG